MLYVASAEPATVQLAALKCDFIVPSTDVLIVNKLTRLEVFHVDTDSNELRLALEIPLWDTVAAVTSLKLPGSSTSSLLVLTTSLQLFSLAYSSEAPHILTTSSTSIKEPHGTLSEHDAVIRVDPLLRCIIVHTYNGLLRVIPLGSSGAKAKKGKGARASDATGECDLGRGYNIRLPELLVSSIEFLSLGATEAPTIAVVFGDSDDNRVVISHQIDLDEKELDEGPIGNLILDDPGSEIIIPVLRDDVTDGVIVIGEESARWVSLRGGEAVNDKGKGRQGGSGKVVCALPVGQIQAWTPFDGSTTKFLLGDIYGKLLLLEVIRNNSGRVSSLICSDLGDTSSPTSIVFLSPILVYLSSRFADSQLIQLPRSLIAPDSAIAMDADDEGLQLVASFASLAPIHDSCVVRTEGGGYSHVVTCSGAYKGGSLRVVRQGVGLNELANLDMEDIQKLWRLRSSPQSEGSLDDVLIVGLFNETRALSFSSTEGEGEEIEEVDLPGFVTDQATLHACNLGPLLVQVTTAGVSWSNSANGITGQWAYDGGKKVTVAESYGNNLLLAIEGGLLVLLHEAGGVVTEQKSNLLPNEIACIDISRVGERTLAVVGLWTAQAVLFISMPDLVTVATQSLETTYLIRSVILATFGEKATYLFAGMGDGSLTTFLVDVKPDSVTVVPRSDKTVTLGTRPITMCAFEAKGVTNIFVSSDRPTVVSRSSDKLIYSSVNLKDINSVTPFNSSSYLGALALSSPTGLRIGRIDDIRRVDIRPIPLDDDEPRRIAHDPATKTYGVLCLRRDVDRTTGEQARFGTVKIFDDQSFELLANFPLQLEEEGQSIGVVKTSDERTAYFVGTALVDPAESEPSKGRLMLYQQQGATFVQQAEFEIKGCPYAIAPLSGGYAAAAISSQVIVYDLSDPTIIKPVSNWGGVFIALTLVSRDDDTLLVGDAMRSMSLLSFIKSPVPKIVEQARDYSSRYMSAIAVLGSDDEFIGCETDLNLFTAIKENVTTNRSMADEYALSPRGMFHLGEMVLKFCQGSLIQQFGESGGIASPRLVFTTSAGSVGVVAELDAASSKSLSDLERNMRRVVKGVGGLKQEEWRSFKSERQTLSSAGFVDGEFVELLGSLSAEEMEAVLQGGSEFEKLTETKEDLLKLVEELARLH